MERPGGRDHRANQPRIAGDQAGDQRRGDARDLPQVPQAMTTSHGPALRAARMPGASEPEAEQPPVQGGEIGPKPGCLRGPAPSSGAPARRPRAPAGAASAPPRAASVSKASPTRSSMRSRTPAGYPPAAGRASGRRAPRAWPGLSSRCLPVVCARGPCVRALTGGCAPPEHPCTHAQEHDRLRDGAVARRRRGDLGRRGAGRQPQAPEVKVRLPRELAALEAAVVKAVRAALVRGAVDVAVRRRRAPASRAVPVVDARWPGPGARRSGPARRGARRRPTAAQISMSQPGVVRSRSRSRTSQSPGALDRASSRARAHWWRCGHVRAGRSSRRTFRAAAPWPRWPRGRGARAEDSRDYRRRLESAWPSSEGSGGRPAAVQEVAYSPSGPTWPRR